jgi:hypothetical protein
MPNPQSMVTVRGLGARAASSVGGVLVWVDPLSRGKTRVALDILLRDVAARVGQCTPGRDPQDRREGGQFCIARSIWAVAQFPLHGWLVQEILERLYHENRLCTGTLRIGERIIGPLVLRVPLLAVVNREDAVAWIDRALCWRDARRVRLPYRIPGQSRCGPTASRDPRRTAGACNRVARHTFLASRAVTSPVLV